MPQMTSRSSDRTVCAPAQSYDRQGMGQGRCPCAFQSFDAALEHSAVDDIERLAHIWLISEPPQVIELNAGRRISDALITAVEHRVVQLRRADDFITGAASRDIVRNERDAQFSFCQRPR